MHNRRTMLDFPRNEAGLVDKFIGTAFDAVYQIYINLEEILNSKGYSLAAKAAAEAAYASELASKLNADNAAKSAVEAARDAANLANAVVDAISARDEAAMSALAAEASANAASLYAAGLLPPAETPPNVRVDGSPLKYGDRYFNLVDNSEYIYKPTGWENNDSLEAISQLLSDFKVVSDYAAFRNYHGKASKVFVAAPGVSGSFVHIGKISDNFQKIDDGGVTIITVTGEVYRREFTGAYDSRWWGVVESLVVNSTDTLQQAINTVCAEGGGDLWIPKNIIVSQTKETGTTIQIKGDGSYTEEPLTTQGCVIVKSGVTLVGDGEAITNIINPSSPNRITVVLYDMENGGGIKNLTVHGGKGVQTQVSSLDVWMRDMVLDYFRIFDSTSYGLGLQAGLYLNNRISNFHIKNTAQDAFDHKARPRDGLYPVGITIENGICEKYGQTSGTESAGFDIRGLVHINNVVCRDFYVLGKNNRGIRLSTGIHKLMDHRVGSDKSSLTNFYIDSGNAAGMGSVGLDIMEGSSVSVVGGVIENCPVAFTTSDTTTGNGTGEGIKLIGVEAIGSHRIAFKCASPNVTLIACKAKQLEERFVANLGNLVDGQNVLTTLQPFDPTTVRVYRNTTLLALNTDYTLTGSTVVNLVTPATSTEEYLVVTPVPVGFDFADGAERSGTNGVLVGCSSKGATIPVRASDKCSTTLTRVGNNFDNQVGYRESIDGSFFQPYGTADNINADIRAKGAADVVLRAMNSRSIVATNPLGAVNWVELRGSAAGGNIRIAAQGSDANISLLLQGKGSGGVKLAARNYSSDAAAAAGGVDVDGLYHTDGAVRIRRT